MKRMTSNQMDQGYRQGRQTPVDKKLKLAQYIRAENMDNRMKVRQRERILYGMKDNMPLVWNRNDSMRMDEIMRSDYYSMGMNDLREQELPGSSTSTFRLRMAAAVILFIAFLLCDAGQYKIFGFSMNDVCGMISEDYFNIYEKETTPNGKETGIIR